MLPSAERLTQGRGVPKTTPTNARSSHVRLLGSPLGSLLGPLLVIVIVLLAPARVGAQATTEEREAEARAHFRLGQSHYDLGHFAEAAVELERAYELSQRADLLYNLYIARRDAGQHREAAAALRLYLERAENIENAALLRHRLSALEAQIASEESGAGSDEPSEPTRQTTEESVGASPATESSGDATVAVRPEPVIERTPSPVGIAILATGGAALIGAVVTGVLALDRFGALERSCGDRTCPPGFEAQRDEGASLSLATDVLLVSGGVLAITGAVLLATVTDEHVVESPRVTAVCGPDGCAAQLTTRF